VHQLPDSALLNGRSTEAWVARTAPPDTSGPVDPAPARELSADQEAPASNTLPNRRLLAGLCLSLALHAAGVLAVAISWANSESGLIEQPSEAITIEVIESAVLEAIDAESTTEAAAPSSAAAAQEGNSHADTAASAPQPEQDTPRETKSVEEASSRPEAPDEAEQDASTAAPQEAAEIDERALQQPADAGRDDVRDEKAPAAEQHQDSTGPKRKERDRERAKTPARRGGPTATSSAGSARLSGRASASRGSMLSYAAQVRAKVAGNKPPGGGHRGTSVIAFGLTTAGRLAYASVARSSGSASLDQAALSAVRRAAPFPDPPAGASPAALRFSISFHFR